MASLTAQKLQTVYVTVQALGFSVQIILAYLDHRHEQQYLSGTVAACPKMPLAA